MEPISVGGSGPLCPEVPGRYIYLKKKSFDRRIGYVISTTFRLCLLLLYCSVIHHARSCFFRTRSRDKMLEEATSDAGKRQQETEDSPPLVPCLLNVERQGQSFLLVRSPSCAGRSRPPLSSGARGPDTRHHSEHTKSLLVF